MSTFYLICAIFGGTVLLLQFAMTLMGVGGDSADGDFGGGDAGGDAGAGVDDGGAFDAGDTDLSPDGSEHSSEHSTIWFFKVVTFQTLTAALAFFGIAGKAAESAQMSELATLAVAFAAGAAAMYGVYYLIRGLHQFNADGTVQISRTVGLPATVYIPIPAANGGAGAVQMKVQNRIMEFQAMTAQERLPSGARVKVVAVIGPETVEVERLIEVETPSHA